MSLSSHARITHASFLHRSAVAIGAAVACGVPALAQSVPGFLVETFANPPSPTLMAFAADGTLYAGRDDDPAGSITAVFVTKIDALGTSAPYGLSPILDPDALVVDNEGSASGIAGSVLVGGLVTNSGPGRISAIHPDGAVVTLFESAGYGNISELKFDQKDRLLFVSASVNSAFVSQAGAMPTPLFATTGVSVYLTVAPDGRIFTSTDSGVVQVNAADGTLLNASFAQFSGRVSIEFANGGGFGTALLALEVGTGKFFSVSEAGVKTQIGSDIVTGTQGADLAIGPCGAVYVSRRQFDDVLRISKPASADIDDNGIVDGADLGLLLGAWGSADCAADFNGDGVVDGADLGVLLGAWG